MFNSWKHLKRAKAENAYTLIEALVASAVLMIGIGAAASMSLTLITQEEINERSARAANHLECCAALFYMGIDTDDIPEIMTEDRVITNLVFKDVSPSGVDMTQIALTFRPSDAEVREKDNKEEWTGGDKRAKRTFRVRMIRGPSAYETAP